MLEAVRRRAPPVPAAEWMRQLPAATRLAFCGDAAARAAALPVWGVEFSAEACRAHARSTRATLWLGPDEYLLLDFGARASSDAGTDAGVIAGANVGVGAGGGAAEIAAALDSATAGVPHSVVDISHRQFALEISGPHATTILNGACPLDLDLAEFPIGMCTRTVLAKAEIVLWRTREDAFHLEVWRSFAGYVTGVLCEIAAEFYPTR
jgi:sarcosine oxidase subunit gamma